MAAAVCEDLYSSSSDDEEIFAFPFTFATSAKTFDSRQYNDLDETLDFKMSKFFGYFLHWFTRKSLFLKSRLLTS